MTAWQKIWVGALVGVLAGAPGARADVTAQTDAGFVSRNVVVVAARPAAVWKRLVMPAEWWSSDHTFSGDAANLTLEPVAGGCFCEKLPGEDPVPAKGDRATGDRAGGVAHPLARGGVVHMRVVFVDRAKAMRLSGALGPLQSEAVNATLTITLTPIDDSTRVIFEYVVGGYMRYPPQKIASAVDIVLSNQLLSLAKAFGPAAASISTAGPPANASETPAPDAPPQPAYRGLGPDGVLLPRGRVWSLPSNTPGGLPPPAEPAPAASEPAATPAAPPLPTAPVQEDVTPAGGNAPDMAAPGVTQAVPQDRAVDRTGPAPSAKPKPKQKKPLKPVLKPAPDTDEPSKDSIDSAFDAAFGGAPRPPRDPQ